MENSEWLKEDDEQRMLKECYEDGEYAAFNRGEMLTVLSRLATAYRKLAERDRWIPCSEQFPDEDAIVLVAVPYTGVHKGKMSVRECDYYSGAGQHIFTDRDNNEFEHTDIYGWRPLPAPPKETPSEKLDTGGKSSQP